MAQYCCKLRPLCAIFCFKLDPSFYQEGCDNKTLAIEMLTIYLNRRTYNLGKDHGHKHIHTFLNQLKNDEFTSDSIAEHLGVLYSTSFPKQDEYIREEGHRHTAITMIAGLMYFSEFRQKMLERYNELNNIISFEEELPSEQIEGANSI
jgi:hypothetical protein